MCGLLSVLPVTSPRLRFCSEVRRICTSTFKFRMLIDSSRWATRNLMRSQILCTPLSRRRRPLIPVSPYPDANEFVNPLLKKHGHRLSRVSASSFTGHWSPPAVERLL